VRWQGIVALAAALRDEAPTDFVTTDGQSLAMFVKKIYDEGRSKIAHGGSLALLQELSDGTGRYPACARDELLDESTSKERRPTGDHNTLLKLVGIGESRTLGADFLATGNWKSPDGISASRWTIRPPFLMTIWAVNALDPSFRVRATIVPIFPHPIIMSYSVVLECRTCRTFVPSPSCLARSRSCQRLKSTTWN
jgi:hypothetical protein